MVLPCFAFFPEAVLVPHFPLHFLHPQYAVNLYFPKYCTSLSSALVEVDPVKMIPDATTNIAITTNNFFFITFSI